MEWKDKYFDALFPFDERVQKLPYFLKGQKEYRAKLDSLIPDRKKPDWDLAKNLLISNLPSMFYKYRCVNDYSISSLQNDTLWMSRPCDFNDPFDSVLKEDTKCLEILYDAMVNCNIITSEQRDELNEIFSLLGIQRLQKTVLVGCLSESNDSILMWSHYADSHKGFCIGYIGNEVFDYNKNNLFPVFYSEANPQISDSALGFDNAGLYAILRKDKQWKYEKEWRIIIETKQVNGGENLLLPKAKAIYLGARMNMEDKKHVISIGESKNMDIYESVLDTYRGKLVFKRVNEI